MISGIDDKCHIHTGMLISSFNIPLIICNLRIICFAATAALTPKIKSRRIEIVLAKFHGSHVVIGYSYCCGSAFPVYVSIDDPVHYFNRCQVIVQ